MIRRGVLGQVVIGDELELRVIVGSAAHSTGRSVGLTRSAAHRLLAGLLRGPATHVVEFNVVIESEIVVGHVEDTVGVGGHTLLFTKRGHETSHKDGGFLRKQGGFCVRNQWYTK